MKLNQRLKQGAKIGLIIGLGAVGANVWGTMFFGPEHQTRQPVSYTQTAEPIRDPYYPVGEPRGLDYACPKGYLIPAGFFPPCWLAIGNPLRPMTTPQPLGGAPSRLARQAVRPICTASIIIMHSGD